jgi:hypothetical protein
MTRPFFGFRTLCQGALLAAVLWAAPAAADEIPEEAKLYFKNGVELIQGQPPNYQDAYYQFKLAWEKSKSWKVLSNWGLCALKLERDGEAIWAYTEYLSKAGKDVDPDERKDLQRDLLLLNGNAATVNVMSDVADLEIVDARAGSPAPPQSYRLENGQLTLRLRAGSHTLTASSQGKQQRWEVTLSPGRNEEHHFEFAVPGPAPASAAPPATAPAAAPATAAPAPKRGGSVRSVGYVVGGLGLVAVGAGVFVGSGAKDKESQARGKCDNRPITGFTCPESVRGDFESAQSQARTANVLLIAGGVVAAAGVGMILFGGPKNTEQSSATLQLSTILGPRDAGLFATGSF